MTPEGRIKAACIRYLERRHIRAWNNPTGAVRIADRWVHFGKKGSADIIGLLPGGRFMAVEVKALDGRLSPEQKQFIADIRGEGGFAVCVKSWKELDAALRGAGYAGDDMALFAGEQPCISEARQGFKPEVEMLNAHSGLLRS